MKNITSIKANNRQNLYYVPKSNINFFIKIIKFLCTLISENFYFFIRRLTIKFLVYFNYSNAENNIENQIIKFFKFKKNKFFIEVGAGDGIYLSNTLLLEKKYNWKGILIEPIKEQFEICKKNRKKSIVFHAAVGNPKSKKKIINIINDKEQSSLKKLFFHKKRKINKKPERVQLKSITALIKYSKIKKIDFFILDVEGYEKEVLEGLIIKNFKIKYLLVETFNINKIKKYCKKRGWKYIDQWSNKDFLFKLN